MDERRNEVIRFRSKRKSISNQQRCCGANDHGEGIDYRVVRREEICDDGKDILAQFKPYVRTEHLHLYEEEENPIWRRILQQMEVDSRADDVIETDEKLLDLLRPIFTPFLINRISASHLYSKSSFLGDWGPSYLRRGCYAWFVEKLIEDIIDEMCEADEDNGEAESSATEVGAGAVTCQGMTGESATQKRRLPDPMTQEGHSFRAAGSGEPDDDPFVRRYFENFPFRKVHVEGFVAPLKGTHGRLSTIMGKSLKFGEMVIRDYGQLPVPALRPGEDISLDTLVYIFHGTRVRHMRGFKNRGISSRPNRSDFSRYGPAFYVSNSIRYAYEHVLLNVLRGCDGDCMAIYFFLVPIGELEGFIPMSNGGEKLDVKSFRTQDTEWADLLKHNWSNEGTTYPPPPLQDVTIGPIGVGKWIEGDKQYGTA